MEDLNLQVIKGFGRKLKSCNKVKGMYLCNTDRGTKLVKKLDISKEKIMFEHIAKEKLYNNGFKNIDRFCVSLDGLPYYIFNGFIYTMSDYIDGIECDLSKNLNDAIVQVAQMHNKAYGLKYFNAPLNLYEFYNKRLIEIARLKKRINNLSSFTKLDILILQNYDYYYEQCKKAISILETSNYDEFYKNTQNKGLFCHNNYREENIVINIDGIYIINFDNCLCDIQMADLANIIRRYMKKPYCQELEAYNLLEVYNKIKSIDKEELKILLAMLTFPYKFTKVCNKYFNKRRSWIQNGITYSLEVYLANKDKNDKLLKLIEKDI